MTRCLFVIPTIYCVRKVLNRLSSFKNIKHILSNASTVKLWQGKEEKSPWIKHWNSITVEKRTIEVVLLVNRDCQRTTLFRLKVNNHSFVACLFQRDFNRQWCAMKSLFLFPYYCRDRELVLLILLAYFIWRPRCRNWVLTPLLYWTVQEIFVWITYFHV